MYQEYHDIIENFGEPFQSEGQYRTSINHLFFAKLFLRDTHIKYFNNFGWMQCDTANRWRKITKEDVLLELRALLLRVMKENKSQCFSQITTSLLCKITEMIRLEQEHACFHSLEPDIIPVTNGILFWNKTTKSIEFRNYTKEDFILDTLTVSYTPKAKSHLFEEKICEIIPDRDDRKIVQEYLGASLFPVNRTRKFLLFQGEGGCGKSLLVLLISRILGENRVFDLNFKQLADNFGFSDLTNQTLLTASEAASRGLYSSGGEFVKKVVGGDYFQTSQKFKNERIKHFGNFSLIIVTNNKMRIAFEGQGREWKDRMLPIIFRHHIPEEHQDRTLAERLLNEAGDAILNWILEGSQRVRANNWKIELTADQKARRDQLIETIHSMDLFVQTYIKRSAGNEFSSKAAYELYIKKQEEMGFEYLEEQAFYKRLAKSMGTEYNAVGCNSIGGRRIRGYRGFELLD